MRLFFALEPSKQDKMAIERWRNTALPTFDKPVPAANFHLTLAFLGQTSSAQLDALIHEVGRLSLPPPFAVHLDHLGYWPKPKALWLGCEHLAPEHSSLNKALNTAASCADFKLQKRPYLAHLTLLRKCPQNPHQVTLTPSFSMDFNEFHLFESLSSPKGVVYQKRHSWCFAPKLNI